MSLRYRAIWRDCRRDLIETARPTFQEWIDGKKLELRVPHEGTEQVESAEVLVQEASDGHVRGLRMRLSEERAGDLVIAIHRPNYLAQDAPNDHHRPDRVPNAQELPIAQLIL